jgi:hypothetical protein
MELWSAGVMEGDADIIIQILYLLSSIPVLQHSNTPVFR